MKRPEERKTPGRKAIPGRVVILISQRLILYPDRSPEEAALADVMSRLGSGEKMAWIRNRLIESMRSTTKRVQLASAPEANIADPDM